MTTVIDMLLSLHGIMLTFVALAFFGRWLHNWKARTMARLVRAVDLEIRREGGEW